MIEHKPLPLKKWGLWLFLILCTLATAYIMFMGILSVWIGLTHIQQHGYWLPALVGALCTAAVAWIFYRLSKFIFSRMKDADAVRL